MEEKKQEVKVEESNIVVLDRGVSPIDPIVRGCCAGAFISIR